MGKDVEDQGGVELTIRWALEAWCDRREDPNDMPARMVRSWHIDLARCIAQAINAEDGEVVCEACLKPVLRGQFVHCYEDVGEVHVDCDQPNAFSDDPAAAILVGDPLRRATVRAPEGEGEAEYDYYQRTTCACIAAQRYVEDCPKHGRPASGIVAATAGETEGFDERSEQSPVAKPDAPTPGVP